MQVPSAALLLQLLLLIMLHSSGATKASRSVQQAIQAVFAERAALRHLSNPSGAKIGGARTAKQLAAGVDSIKFSGGESEKLAAAKFFAQEEKEWIVTEDMRYSQSWSMVPRLTKEGFKVVPAPWKVFPELRAAYDALSMHAVPEHKMIKPSINGLSPVMNARASEILREGHYELPSKVTNFKTLAPELMGRTVEAVKDVLEEWSATSIEHTQSYGVRCYQRGAVLRRHVDRIATHALSVIINIAQSGMQQHWPLQIQDHNGTWREINLKPGEMLLYESAKLKHERAYALNGTSYANLFINYRPQDWIHKETVFTEDGKLGFTSEEAHDTYYRKAGRAHSRDSQKWADYDASQQDNPRTSHKGREDKSHPDAGMTLWAIPAVLACVCALAFLWSMRGSRTKGTLRKESGSTATKKSRGGKKQR